MDFLKGLKNIELEAGKTYDFVIAAIIIIVKV